MQITDQPNLGDPCLRAAQQAWCRAADIVPDGDPDDQDAVSSSTRDALLADAVAAYRLAWPAAVARQTSPGAWLHGQVIDPSTPGSYSAEY